MTGIRNDATLKDRRAPYPCFVVRLNPDAFDGKRVGPEDRVRAAIEGDRGAKAFLARVQAMSDRFDAVNAGTATLTAEEEAAWRSVEVGYFFYHSKADAHVAAHRAEFAKFPAGAIKVFEHKG